MDSERIDRYRKKILYLEKYYTWLNEWMDQISLEKIHEEKKYQALMGIYHTAQSAAAVIIDIIAMMNKDLAKLVQDNYQNLAYLRSKGIIDTELENGLKVIIGLRNRLAHDYNGIVDKFAWEAIKENQKYLKKFHDVIFEWLNQKKELFEN